MLTTEDVWAELHANIRGFIGRRVREPADVDDIVQRVFLHVHRALPTLRDAEALHPWIYKTTRRAIADYYRAPGRSREVPAGSAVDLAPVEHAEVVADENEQAASRELAACLKPLMARLRAVDQEALRLIEFEDLTQVEAAARLGLSVSGMKSRVQRARVHLRSALDACCRVMLDRRGGVLGYDVHARRCEACDPAPGSEAPVNCADATASRDHRQD
jgi:RNA polymerase sigma-70 factor (ECF subfamily)